MHRFFARFRKADCVAGPAAAELKRKRKRERGLQCRCWWADMAVDMTTAVNCKAAGLLLLLGWKWYVHLTRLFQRQKGELGQAQAYLVAGCHCSYSVLAHIVMVTIGRVARRRIKSHSLTHSLWWPSFGYVLFSFTSSSFPLPPFPFIPLALYLTDHFL